MGGIPSQPVVSMQVIERCSGQLISEHVPLYLRTLYQAMYQNPIGRRMIQFNFVRYMLKSATSRHGVSMDDENSVRYISQFVQTYGVNLEECELPLNEYKTFNEFFSRKLKSGARPIDGEKDESIIVAPADCRLVVYPRLSMSERIWLKGQPFDLSALLGPEVSPLIHSEWLDDPAIFISRLAPNDYHRWHMPVRARCVSIHPIGGDYYSVSPRAVRSCNVLSSNKRLVCVMDSSSIGFGKWVLVAVGAAMVASMVIRDDIQHGTTVLEKGEEHGYFQFGGSTLVVVMNRKYVQWDDDLLKHSCDKNPMEVLLKMGTHIGRRRQIVDKEEEKEENKTNMEESCIEEEESEEQSDLEEKKKSGMKRERINNAKKFVENSANSKSGTASVNESESENEIPRKKSRASSASITSSNISTSSSASM